MSCLRMRTCCCCLDTGKGTVVTAIASIAAAIFTFVFIVLGLFYWDDFSARVRHAYKEIGLGADTIDFIIKVCKGMIYGACVKIIKSKDAFVYWGNIFTLIVIILYVILCVLLMIGVLREQYKHMIPWISVTSMVLPFFAVSFFIQLIFGIVGGGVLAVVVPAVIVLVWCAFWLYGFLCAVSHYRMLKGDIHRPVATLFKR